MIRLTIWRIHGIVASALLIAQLLILAFGPLRLPVGDCQVLLVGSTSSVLAILAILVIVKVLFDPALAWLRSLLSRLSGWRVLLSLIFLGGTYGIGLFAHVYPADIQKFSEAPGEIFHGSFHLLVIYFIVSTLVSLWWAWAICRGRRDPDVCLSRFTVALCWGLVFLVFLSPLVREISHQLIFMMLVLVCGATGACIARFCYADKLERITHAGVARALWILGIVAYFLLMVLVVAKCRLPRNCDDFPFFLQSLSSLLRGEMMKVTWLLDKHGSGISYMGDHFSPILFFLLPFYAVWSAPEMLLIVQVLVVGVAAIPLYFLCREKFPESPLVCFGIGFVYIITPWLQKGLFFDFHQDAFKPVFVFLAFYGLIKRRWGLYAAGLLGVLSAKEDGALVPFVLGLYALIFLRNYRVGLASMAVAVIYAVIVMGIVMPHFYPAEEAYRHIANRYENLGSSYPEILKTILTSPIATFRKCFDADSFHTLLYLFVPLIGLPLISLSGLFLMGPFLAQMMLSHWPYTRTIYFYYPFTTFPMVILALITGLDFLRRRFGKQWGGISQWAGCYLVAATCCFSFFYYPHIERNQDWYDYYYVHNSPMGFRFNLNRYRMTERERVGHAFMRDIVPADVPISVPVRYAAHLSNRPVIRMFPNVSGVDYAFFDVRSQPYMRYLGKQRKIIFDFLADGDFGIVAEQDGFVLARRGADTALNEALIRREMWRYEAEMLHRHTGSNICDPKSDNGVARHAAYWRDSAGAMVFGPYVELVPGDYNVKFRIRGWGRRKDRHVANIRVTTDKGKTCVTERFISGRHLKWGEYVDFDLPFALIEKARVEFPVFYHGNGELWVDRILLQEK